MRFGTLQLCDERAPKRNTASNAVNPFCAAIWSIFTPRLTFTPTCCGGYVWTDQTKSGAWTSPICRCVPGSFIWWRSTVRQGIAKRCPERNGLAYPDGSVVADLEHAGGRFLCRSTERGDLSVRTARHHEPRSRISVHVVCLDRLPAPVRYPHLNGRKGSLPR